MRHDWATRTILAVTHIVGLEHLSSSLHIQKNDTVLSVTHGSQIPSDICKRLTVVYTKFLGVVAHFPFCLVICCKSHLYRNGFATRQ